MTELEYVTGLLGLADSHDTEVLLENTLRLVTRRTGARYGYVEIEAEPTRSEERRVWRALDCSEGHVASIQARISSTIVRTALAQGQPVTSASAIDDPRFKEAGSVRQFDIGAVVCVPFGKRLSGVVYVQSPSLGDGFEIHATMPTQQAARHLTRILEPRRFHIGARLTARQQANQERQERIVEAIAVHGRNLSAIEKSTGISRTQLRRMLSDRDDTEE